MAVRTSWSAFHHRESPGRCRQCRYRSRGEYAPDGYGLLMISSANVINATLYDRLNYNFIRDIAPVAGVAGVPLVMEVHPSVPARTVRNSSPTPRQIPGRSAW